jgi:hypothetical protein
MGLFLFFYIMNYTNSCIQIFPCNVRIMIVGSGFYAVLKSTAYLLWFFPTVGWDANSKCMKQKIKLRHLSVTNSKHRSRILLGVSDIAKSLSLYWLHDDWRQFCWETSQIHNTRQKPFDFFPFIPSVSFLIETLLPPFHIDCFFHFSSHLHFTPPIFLLLWLLLPSSECFFFFVFSHNISRVLIFTFVGYFESHILFTS